ncbi:MAG: MarR family transcriptional regulator [Pseudomonadota bacterium]
MSRPGPDPEIALWVAMNRAHRSVFLAANVKLREANLPPLHWYDVLWSIERNGGSLRPLELEDLLIFEQSNLSHLLHRIEAKGLIERSEFAGDKRGRILTITEIGLTTRRKMWDIYGKILDDKLKPLCGITGRDALVCALSRLS